MLKISPTENLTGITLQGDFNDFYELVESIYRLTGFEEIYDDVYYGVKNRLLGMCYDIRHAYMGDRDIILEDNGMDNERMKWHGMITPTQNVYYSVNVLFPEAIFIAASVPMMYIFAYRYYGESNKKRAVENEHMIMPYSYYLRDKANLDVLFAGIWKALGEVIGDEELEKILELKERTNERYIRYATQYIDKCNIDYLKTDVEKRKDKLKNTVKRIVKKPQAYLNMEADLAYWAKEYNTSMYELRDPKMNYPEEIEW